MVQYGPPHLRHTPIPCLAISEQCEKNMLGAFPGRQSDQHHSPPLTAITSLHRRWHYSFFFPTWMSPPPNNCYSHSAYSSSQTYWALTKHLWGEILNTQGTAQSEESETGMGKSTLEKNARTQPFGGLEVFIPGSSTYCPYLLSLSTVT